MAALLTVILLMILANTDAVSDSRVGWREHPNLLKFAGVQQEIEDHSRA